MMLWRRAPVSSRQKIMPELENIVASDEWRTLHRVLPKDLKDEVCHYEDFVGKIIGRSVSLGAGIEIWSILLQLIREHEPQLEELARNWKEGA
jgi:hypothetical protein